MDGLAGHDLLPSLLHAAALQHGALGHPLAAPAYAIDLTASSATSRRVGRARRGPMARPIPQAQFGGSGCRAPTMRLI